MLGDLGISKGEQRDPAIAVITNPRPTNRRSLRFCWAFPRRLFGAFSLAEAEELKMLVMSVAFHRSANPSFEVGAMIRFSAARARTGPVEAPASWRRESTTSSMIPAMSNHCRMPLTAAL